MKKLTVKQKFAIETTIFFVTVVLFFLNFLPFMDFSSTLIIYGEPTCETGETKEIDENESDVPMQTTSEPLPQTTLPLAMQTTTISDNEAIPEEDSISELNKAEEQAPVESQPQEIPTTTPATTPTPSPATTLATTTTTATSTSVDLPEPQKTTSNATTAPINPAEVELVNINTADISELMTLKGIGEVKAQAIIDYRDNNGSFQSVDELLEVKGIGEITLEKLRGFVTV